LLAEGNDLERPGNHLPNFPARMVQWHSRPHWSHNVRCCHRCNCSRCVLLRHLPDVCSCTFRVAAMCTGATSHLCSSTPHISHDCHFYCNHTGQCSHPFVKSPSWWRSPRQGAPKCLPLAALPLYRAWQRWTRKCPVAALVWPPRRWTWQ